MAVMTRRSSASRHSDGHQVNGEVNAKGDLQAAPALAQRAPDISRMGRALRSVTFGGLDGIITTFAIVAGAVGGDKDIAVVLVMGFSSILVCQRLYLPAAPFPSLPACMRVSSLSPLPQIPIK